MSNSMDLYERVSDLELELDWAHKRIARIDRLSNEIKCLKSRNYKLVQMLKEMIVCANKSYYGINPDVIRKAENYVFMEENHD